MAGDASTVELASSTTPKGVKSTVAVAVIARLSVTSVAAKIQEPTVVEVTVKVATPNSSVVAEAGAMTGVPGPEALASETVLPETPALVAFFKVTVIVEVANPSASTEASDATTVELARLTALAENVTPAFSATVTVSVVSVASNV